MEANVTKIVNPARDRLERGERAVGIGIRLARSTDIVPAMRGSGYDWLFLDLEHGTMPLDVIGQLSIAGLSAPVSTIVRVPKGDYALATRALDSGASGIILPHVDTAAEAEEAVRHLKYPPLGHRSVGPTPQLDFQSLPLAETMALINASSLVIAMIESPAAVEDAERIAAVGGVDVLLVGASDLSSELGIAGQFGDQRLHDAVEQVVAACRKQGKWAGIGGVYDDVVAPKLISLGCQLVLAGTDLNLLMQAASEKARQMRAYA